MNLSLERRAIEAVRRNKRIWIAHFFGNAALVYLFYAWLGIPDRTAGYVALSAIAGLALVLLALWLHGATLAWFQAFHSGVEKPRTAGRILRRLPALTLWAIVVAVLSNLILLLLNYRTPVANTVASWLTLQLRRPVAPETVGSVFGFLVWLGGYFKPLCVLLPWAASAASQGFGAYGLKHALAPARTAFHPRYWLTLIAVFLVGILLPWMLIDWKPDFANIPFETASLIVRFLAAYALAITAWLFLVSTVSVWNTQTKQQR